jgi:hypothetical protein
METVSLRAATPPDHAFLQDLTRELLRADAVGKPVRLHTLRPNRAQELYRRHGFFDTSRDDIYVNMERPAEYSGARPLQSK